MNQPSGQVPWGASVVVGLLVIVVGHVVHGQVVVWGHDVVHGHVVVWGQDVVHDAVVWGLDVVVVCHCAVACW